MAGISFSNQIYYLDDKFQLSSDLKIGKFESYWNFCFQDTHRFTYSLFCSVIILLVIPCQIWQSFLTFQKYFYKYYNLTFILLILMYFCLKRSILLKTRPCAKVTLVPWCPGVIELVLWWGPLWCVFQRPYIPLAAHRNTPQFGGQNNE
jgi:hypothetical protein